MHFAVLLRIVCIEKERERGGEKERAPSRGARLSELVARETILQSSLGRAPGDPWRLFDPAEVDEAMKVDTVRNPGVQVDTAQSPKRENPKGENPMRRR